MIASRVLVVSEVVAELAFIFKLLGIQDVDVYALYPSMTVRNCKYSQRSGNFNSMRVNARLCTMGRHSERQIATSVVS